jgi:cytochrome c
MRPILVLNVLVLVASFALSQPLDTGKELFDRRCGGCHSLDRPMEGPRLRGVYGRQAASTRDFEYSDALKKSKLTWNEDLLDKWLTDTEALVPGNDMSFRVPNRDERHAIIAYLKSVSRGTMSSASGPP